MSPLLSTIVMIGMRLRTAVSKSMPTMPNVQPSMQPGQVMLNPVLAAVTDGSGAGAGAAASGGGGNVNIGGGGSITSTGGPNVSIVGGDEAVAISNRTSAMIDIAKVQGQVHAQSVQKVGELADKNPHEAVSIIRNWLHEDAA